MPQSTPSSCKYSLKYTFEPHDSSAASSGLSVTVETDTNDTDAHKDDAFAQLARMYGLPNTDAARDRWTIDRVEVGWANEPWSDWDELEATLDSFPGVKSLRYEDPYEGAYGPPTYHLRVESGRADAVRMAAERYFSGLSVHVDSPSQVRIVVSPLL